jgi:3-oxoacyl-[acyl-carrier-protein] synthase-1
MKTLGFIAGVGARTGIGLDARQTGFFLRTGTPSITGAPLVDPDGESVAMSFDRTLDPFDVGEERAAALARAALGELARPLRGGGRTLKTKFVLALDEPRVGKDGRAIATNATGVLGAKLAPLVREHFSDAPVEVVARGAGGSAAALASALGELGRGPIEAIVFGGVHTDYDPVSIAWLANAGRLYTPKNLDALIPGECAAFVLIGQRTLGQRVARDAATGRDTGRDALEPARAALEPMARIHGVGSGWEEATPWNDKSAFKARGLTAAVRAATKDLPDEMKIGWSLADHTFELLRIHEWQAMVTRTRERWGPPMVSDAPAQRLGHMGAAALPLELVIAAEGFSRAYAPFPLGLCFAGSDAGERAAVVVGNV